MWSKAGPKHGSVSSTSCPKHARAAPCLVQGTDAGASKDSTMMAMKQPSAMALTLTSTATACDAHSHRTALLTSSQPGLCKAAEVDGATTCGACTCSMYVAQHRPSTKFCSHSVQFPATLRTFKVCTRIFRHWIFWEADEAEHACHTGMHGGATTEPHHPP